MTPERSCAKPYTRYTVVLQWRIVAFPWAWQSQCLSVLLFSRSQLQRSRGQHANWCCGTASIEASRPQAGVYSQPPSPVYPLTSSLLNSPSLSLPEVQAGYYPCVWGKLCTVRETRKRSLWSKGEKKRAALLSTDLLCVSALSLINDRLCESRPTVLTPGSMPCQRPKTQTTQLKTPLASKPRSCFIWGNVLLGAQVTNRCPFNLCWKTRAQLEMWHLLGWALETLRPPCGCYVCQLPPSVTELLLETKRSGISREICLLAFPFISVAVAKRFNI